MNASLRKPYERPTIVRHRSGLMNKMGGLPALRPQSQIDGVDVEELVEAYGSPLFVYSERTIRAKYRELRDAFELRWPRVQIAWSYKTCYLDAICRIYHDEGAWAEVVSGMEMHKAMRNGQPVHQIVYNGPHKDEGTLEEALLGGAKVHIDHFDELAMAEAIAKKHGIRPKVALRLNIDTGTQPRWDRFGFHLDSGQAWDAARRLVAGGALELAGLHCHLGTFVLDADSYGEASAKIARFANRLRRELGVKMDWLDLGGGFASRARLKSQYLPGEQVSPAFSQYAESLTRGLRELDVPHDEMPLLILETGRALIDEAGTLISSVLANKRLADGRRSMVIDAGVNVLFTSFWYKHDIVPTTMPSGVPEPTVIYGPLCMNIDVVCDNLQLPPLASGSRILVKPVGAYNVTQSMQFIHLRPAVCLIGLDGRHAEIRRKETLDDLVMPESVPAWLKDQA
jgi:diaminopimelate decarboxylase